MAKGVIQLGDERYNKDYLKGITEKVAVQRFVLAGHDADRVRKAWKMANGFTVPNYVESEETDKPKRKRTTKKKKDA